MKEFILSADAGCDLTPDLQEKYDVEIMPLRYNVNGEEYLSGDGKMPPEKICEQMKAGAKTSTSQANPAEAEVYLEELLKRGKDIVHITMSSAMSGTYETMKRLAETLNETHDNKVYVVDSLCQCAGYGVLLQWFPTRRTPATSMQKPPPNMPKASNCIFFTISPSTPSPISPAAEEFPLTLRR